jgi:hypothetical protein
MYIDWRIHVLSKRNTHHVSTCASERFHNHVDLTAENLAVQLTVIAVEFVVAHEGVQLSIHL